LKQKRFIFTYLVVMSVFTALSALQLIRIKWALVPDYGREQMMIGWSLLGIFSLAGAFFSLIRMHGSKPSLKFGESFFLDTPQEERTQVVRDVGKLNVRRIRRKLSKKTVKFSEPLAMAFVWFCAALFLVASWKVWNTPQPWPMFTSVEVVFLVAGAILAIVVACGLGLKKRWAAVLGYIFGFMQLLWFPIGLLSGLLYLIMLKKGIFNAFSEKVSLGIFWRLTGAQSVSLASKRAVNEQLRAEFKQQDAA
jgi:hypothetical protein